MSRRSVHGRTAVAGGAGSSGVHAPARAHRMRAPER